MAVNPDVALVLTCTDLPSLMAAINTSNPDMLRMADGSQPTEAERQLILSATHDDLTAANQLMQLAAQAAQDGLAATQRARAVLNKYTGDTQAAVADVWHLMSPQDREEFRGAVKDMRLADEIGGA